MKEKGCHPYLEGGTKPPQKGFTACAGMTRIADFQRSHFKYLRLIFQKAGRFNRKDPSYPLAGVVGEFHDCNGVIK
jgi:hypothetical protein